MHPSPVYTGGASRRTTAWAAAGILAAAALTAAGWSAWRGAGRTAAPGAGTPEASPAAPGAPDGGHAAGAGSAGARGSGARATPAPPTPTVPTGPGAPPVAVVLASATAAAAAAPPHPPRRATRWPGCARSRRPATSRRRARLIAACSVPAAATARP